MNSNLAHFLASWRGKLVLAVCVTGLLLAGCVLIVTVVVPRVWKSTMYPSPPAMPAVVPETTLQLIERLEATLKAKAPEVYASLQPGLAPDRITALEAQSGIVLTDDLRQLYAWRNGTTPDRDFIPGHRFMPLDEAVQEYVAMKQQTQGLSGIQAAAYAAFAGHRDSWLTIFPDGAGDGYCYDHQRRTADGAFFYHFAEVGYYTWFPSLRNFLAGVSECYEVGVYRITNDPMRPEEDYGSSTTVWQKYSQSNQ